MSTLIKPKKNQLTNDSPRSWRSDLGFRARQNERRMLWELMAILVAIVSFSVKYISDPSAPGFNKLDLTDWFGWFDQGHYLQSAQSFANGQIFSADAHFYPPLYPALAVIGVKFSLSDPFVIVNIGCLVIFVYSFICFARSYVATWIACFIAAITVCMTQSVVGNFVIPWTSTLSAGLLGVGILELVSFRAEVMAGDYQKSWEKSLFRVAIVSLILGMLVLTRPSDSIVGGILWLGVVFNHYHQIEDDLESFQKRLTLLAVATFSLGIGLAIFFGFNVIVYGSPLGSYFEAVNKHGFTLGALIQKFILIVVDAEAIYGESNSGLIAHFPWVAPGIAALWLAVRRGDTALRAVAAAITVHFLLYLPYNDLLPTGLWRYLNVHYFKWTLPYLALFAALGVGYVIRVVRSRYGFRNADIWVFVGITFFVACLRLEVEKIQSVALDVARQSLSTPLHLHVPLAGQSISVIDIESVQDVFESIYFGNHQLVINDREIALYKDYRVIPYKNGIRILLQRPIAVSAMDLILDSRLQCNPKIHVVAGRVQYGFAMPAFSLRSFLDEIKMNP